MHHLSKSQWRTLVALSAFLSLGKTFGDDSKSPEFQQTIRQLADVRARIKAYDVTITGKVDNKVERQQLSDGSIYEVERVPTGFTLEIVFDAVQSKLLAARKDTYRIKATGKLETTDWSVFGRSQDEVKTAETWTSVRGAFFHKGSIVFFDPLGLGICFAPEFRRGDPWERTVANYLKWPRDFQAKQLGDGKVQFTRSRFSMVIDTERDHWPVSMVSHRTADEINIKTDIKLVSKNGFWVPDSATVGFKDETTELDFWWHSVNQPVAKKRFAREEILVTYGIIIR
jgi:hypothetical protein